ncbi:glycosyltransferase family 4 protein [Cohnella pontilimi]|uniref:Glycosyltransferase family 4 protein n=1 Tax=Cohnella pontilimi TaxID=2564100 RepID=A0A4U0FL16_9BACL|nr:glycosyltransferase family 4 protein [Cohnella pontilimi]TJY44262.1 glycosyltransferase family 4 protein [Cohnella pontilimi]
MKILLATCLIQPHIGGVGSYINALRKKLSDEGHEVDVLAQSPDYKSYYVVGTNRVFEKSLVSRLIDHNIQQIYKQTLALKSGYLFSFEIERYTLELAAAYLGLNGYNLIHTQDIISTRALYRVKPKHTPLVATIHGCLAIAHEFMEFYTPGSLPAKYNRMQEYLGTISSDAAIVPTVWLKNLLMEMGVPEEQLTTVANGLDITQFMADFNAESNVDFPVGKTVFLYPARLDSLKGGHILMQALGKLLAVRGDWVCWIAGKGPLLDSMVKQCQEYGLNEHVLFLGERHDVPALLRKATIFVHPSIQENHPYSVMEAQLAGKPVLVTNAGGLPEMVSHGITGLVSEAGDMDSLYLNMLMMLENPGLGQELGERARSFAMRHWSVDRMYRDTWAVYQQARMKHKYGRDLHAERRQ